MTVNRKKLDDARKQFSATRRTLDSEMNHLGSLELKDNELMAIFLSEERHLEEGRKEVDNLKSAQFKQGQKLFDERHQERDYISNIAGAHSQNKNLKCKIAQLEDQVWCLEVVHILFFKLEASFWMTFGKRNLISWW